VGLDDYQDEAAPRPGGCALNVAWSLRLAGARDVAVAGWVGSDGAHLRELLAGRGVDVSLLRQVEGASSRQRIRLPADGDREFCGYTGGVLCGRRPDEALREALASAGCVYVPISDVTIAWAEAAWDSGAPVALDLLNMEDVDEAFTAEAVRRSDVVFCGLQPELQADWIARLGGWAGLPGAALVVVTLGGAGAVAFSGQRRVPVQAQPVRGGRVVDTTGCGDAFAGTLLAARARGLDLEAALVEAARRGAIVASHRGAVAVDALSEDPPPPIMGPQDEPQ
jgi:ribokinase